jgi:hypothetical protein
MRRGGRGTLCGGGTRDSRLVRGYSILALIQVWREGYKRMTFFAWFVDLSSIIGRCTFALIVELRDAGPVVLEEIPYCLTRCFRHSFLGVWIPLLGKIFTIALWSKIGILRYKTSI